MTTGTTARMTTAVPGTTAETSVAVALNSHPREGGAFGFPLYRPPRRRPFRQSLIPRTHPDSPGPADTPGGTAGLA